MNKEAEFTKILGEVKKLAREQGNMITQEQVTDAFRDLDLAEEKMQAVYDYLLQSKIGIGQHLAPEDYLTEQEMNYLQNYLEEIEVIGDVTEGEKEAITISAMAGDLDAQKRLSEIYLKDVAQIAKLYAGQGVLLEDLIGEGNMALILAVTMLGSQESAADCPGLIAKMIMDAMEEHILEHTNNKKIDKRVEEKVNLVAEKATKLREELRRDVTVEELAQETGLSEKLIRDSMRMSGFKIEGIDYNE